MKHLIKAGRVAAWVTSDGGAYMVLADEDVTDEEIEAAIAEEEIVQEFRDMKEWN